MSISSSSLQCNTCGILSLANCTCISISNVAKQVEVAEILLNLPAIIFESIKRRKFCWGSRKRRSKTRSIRSFTSLKDKNPWISREMSPSSPLSLPIADKIVKFELNERRQVSEKKKTKTEELKEMLVKLSSEKQQLKQEIQSARDNILRLRPLNSSLKARLEQNEKPEKTIFLEKIDSSLNLSRKAGEIHEPGTSQQHLNPHTSDEIAWIIFRSRLIHRRMIAAAEARRRRREIQKGKNSLSLRTQFH